MDYVWDVDQDDFENWKQWSNQDVSWEQYQSIIADRSPDSQIVRPTVNLVKTILELLKIEPRFQNAGVALDVFHRGLAAIKGDSKKTKVSINSAIRNSPGGELLIDCFAESTKIGSQLLTEKLLKLKDVALATLLIQQTLKNE